MSRVRKGAVTYLRLESGATVKVLPFAPVGEGDRVFVSTVDGSIHLVLDDGQGEIDLGNPWLSRHQIEIGNERLEILIKEVESEHELAGLASLKQFHYRGERTAGRAVPLIAVASHRLLPEVIAFIEVTSAMLVNTARKSILDRPFSDAESCVCWQRWDMSTAKNHTKRLARISRCVVYPELRGLGIASRLARAAAHYARERWQFGGARPVFLEITADMLRYSPFVQSAGFIYVGDTEGNENRMLRDMRYLLKRTIASGSQDDFPQGGGGIMSLQRSYATTLLGVMSRRKLGLEQLLNLLRRSPEKLTDDEWIALHRVFRRPKPTYMYGLTRAATEHLRAAASTRRMSTSNGLDFVKNRRSQLGKPIVQISGLRLETSVAPSTSPRARKVAEAFGVVAKRMDATLVNELSLDVAAGEIILITGPSGTGKSLLIRAIHAALSGAGKMPTGVALRFDKAVGTSRIGWVQPVDSNKAPVDILNDPSLERVLSLLGTAGLAESSLFVRPAATLSDGQRYRLAIASALVHEPELLLVDAFCEPLDDLSAAAVCMGLRMLTKRNQTSAILATAVPDRLLKALDPDAVVQLLPGRSIKVHRKRPRLGE